MRNAWRECQEELQAAEAAWFDGDNHAKYLAWVHKWTGLVVLELKATADHVEEMQRAHIERESQRLSDA